MVCTVVTDVEMAGPVQLLPAKSLEYIDIAPLEISIPVIIPGVSVDSLFVHMHTPILNVTWYPDGDDENGKHCVHSTDPVVYLQDVREETNINKSRYF